MRTISALIAATLCALALSGPTLSADGKLDRSATLTPDWLEFRTAFAAENLWPEDAFTTKAGRATPAIAVAQPQEFAAIEGAARTAVTLGLDLLQGWGKAADRYLDGNRPTFQVAGN